MEWIYRSLYFPSALLLLFLPRWETFSFTEFERGADSAEGRALF